MAKQDIGLIGLAVMGENLVLNMESKGFSVAVFNRTVAKVDKFIASRAKGKNIVGYHSIEELTAALERPRKVMLLVKAGQAVDDFIEKLIPHLEAGDIITKFDGKQIEKSSDLPRLVGNVKPGTKSVVTVFRRGASKDLTVVVAEIEPEKPARGARSRTAPSREQRPRTAGSRRLRATERVIPRLSLLVDLRRPAFHERRT